MIWSNDLTDAQLRLVRESAYDERDGGGFGVELRGPLWVTARSLVKLGLGTIDGEGGSLPALYFNNQDGAAIFRECDDSAADYLEDDGYLIGVRAALDGMGLPDGAYFGMADELGIEP